MPGLTKRQMRGYMITKQGKYWNTEPERNFHAFALEYGLNLVQNKSLPFVDGVTKYDFQCDFLRPTDDGTWDVDFEIDGPNHDSQRNHDKDIWKDAIKNRQGLKVIHVPAAITQKKWWAYLDKQIQRALLSPSGSVWIAA